MNRYEILQQLKSKEYKRIRFKTTRNEKLSKQPLKYYLNSEVLLTPTAILYHIYPFFYD